MTSYYIDPERCFEVPFRIPLPDKEKMATRLANIRLITKNARERQSVFNVEHRRKLSTRPTKYREKVKAIMECGRLKRFVGNLTERYFDYLNFHQESLNELSPLIITAPSLCPPLSASSPCLFGPPRRGDFNEVINSNLSWSQFAAPVPAGWRERFLQDRQWERHIERRAFHEYSDKEREVEYTALEYQRRQLGVFLQITSNSPPPLPRKCPIPLPLATPAPPLLDILPSEGSELLKCGSRATCNLPSVNSADLIPDPPKIPSQIEIDSTVAPSVRQQLPSEQPTQKSSQSCQLLRRRPLLHVTIPETEPAIPWLDRHICDSPLSGIGVDIPLPSVLLNADAVRAYLDSVHGPLLELPQHEPPKEACPQSPRQQLIPFEWVMETSRMSVEDTKYYDTREMSLVFVTDVQSNMARSPSFTPRAHTNHPRPFYTLKRRASRSSTVTSNKSLKKPHLMVPNPTKNLS